MVDCVPEQVERTEGAIPDACCQKATHFLRPFQKKFPADRPRGWRLKLILVCEPVSRWNVSVGSHPPGRPAARFFTMTREREAAAMGYFALTAVFTLQYLGYVPIPTGVLVMTCVAYVLYDTFKR
jgi:hypothetical protein